MAVHAVTKAPRIVGRANGRIAYEYDELKGKGGGRPKGSKNIKPGDDRQLASNTRKYNYSRRKGRNPTKVQAALEGALVSPGDAIVRPYSNGESGSSSQTFASPPVMQAGYFSSGNEMPQISNASYNDVFQLPTTVGDFNMVGALTDYSIIGFPHEMANTGQFQNPFEDKTFAYQTQNHNHYYQMPEMAPPIHPSFNGDFIANTQNVNTIDPVFGITAYPTPPPETSGDFDVNAFDNAVAAAWTGNLVGIPDSDFLDFDVGPILAQLSPEVEKQETQEERLDFGGDEMNYGAEAGDELFEQLFTLGDSDTIDGNMVNAQFMNAYDELNCESAQGAGE